nr:hypothetical protein [Tanacetum cinerariifolium]
MATTIEQQMALDEALVPSTKRLRIGRSNFRLPSNIQSKESTLQVVYDVLRRSPFFKAFLVTADNILDLEAFREMLHISPRVSGQSFDELPFEEEILDFLRFLGHNAQIKTLSDVNVNKLFQPWRSFAAVINKCLTGKSFGFDSFRDDILFSTIKVVSRHQNTQQYGTILPIELTNKDIRNTKAYKEYYACATREAAPKPKASTTRKRGGSDSSTTPPTAVASLRPITTIAAAPRLTAAAKGKQPARATSPIDPLEVERIEAEQLKIVLRRSRQETHISQHGSSSTDEGTGSKPGVPDVPSDDSEEEISWNSSDEEDVDAQDKGRDDDEGKKNARKDDNDDDNDDEEEIAKLDEQEDTESGEGDDEETKSDGEIEEEETRKEEEESFDPILRTPEDSEDDGNRKEDQGLRVSEEQRLIEEEEADELYRNQESSSVSSFVTSMLNQISDAGVESIFTTASSPIAPLQTSTPIMTPSTIATITTSSDAPIPPATIRSAVLQNLSTFDSVFCFEERVKSLEVNFSKFMQTNQFAEAVSNISGIVHQYMTQQMTEAIREAVQIQTNRLQDSFQRENDEFLRTIDENMKKIIKGRVKS